MEDHRTVERLIQKGDFATSLDLSQTYFLIPVHKDFTPFLAFKFEERFYGFKGMPFGFKDAQRIFTKVIRKVSQEIRRRWKVRCISYLDDVLLLDPDQVKLKFVTQEIVEWFQQLGLIINREKSEFFPKKNFNYLGWTWNTSRMVVSMEQQRRRELRKECIKWMKRVRKSSFAKTRDFASFIGQLSAARFVYKDVSLYMNKMYHLLNKQVKKDNWEGAAQGELHQRTGGLLEARRHINDRCFPLGLRSNLGSWRREISLSQTVQQHHKAPNIQFQGAPCSFIGSQQFFITNHSQPCVQDPSPFRQHQCSVQHQQVGCGTQPPAVIEKDQGHMSVDEIDDDSNPHSRGEKHNRRRIVQVGGRRRLYDKESTSEGSGEGSRSDSRDRRFRKRRKQEEGDMVWSRKSVRSRWSHGRLDKEHNAHSPSNSVDSSESQESKSRESESNHPSSGMEESDMEQLTGRDDVSILRLEELESGFNPGSRPEENGCSTASRGIHGSNNQLVREVGEEWWWKSLRICGVPDRIISVTKESIAKSTCNQYTFGFAHFSREWEELKLGPFPKYFDEWSMDCANCLLSMRDKGGKYSCLCATRSAISLFSKTVYGKDLSKVSLISTIFRSFSFSQTHRKPYTKMWSPDIVLSYYENYWLNEYLSFFDLTVKCILLVMLFTSCRFHELEQISMANSIFENDAIYLSTRLKTSRSREYITVPCLEEVHKRICPARAIHTLWERVKATYENRDTFLLNTTHHTPLTAKGIRTLA
ncbi:putative Reverse transcriptase (RNA-dependent DNA polymerase) [Monocercomonoides exilis]|uniref:putative Reverse transcriptase (RNA-dependent DNA polymerase) n=1 Tax=Monocercomonoides exilis TaxID=2049356 RepID=UPI00355A05D2|nr:putative Reverse transcriptase (RNA-dependent DNA polymerase) [Monocercomonoides exilis]|eukprot:MONOS_12555.1-p1 / transcript=MONOS_12555.1 / gene=MONOS_12555 / organism=Monocercomonoides_exilis_PA203 / gene_product=unspecified product / transcript_product=unspecified product / location=Mono_scaffold00701:19354-21674(+) / protein_length=756 / sequence_SO=supercontig / SO=protein_coding / is_pseudo=false